MMASKGAAQRVHLDKTHQELAQWLDQGRELLARVQFSDQERAFDQAAANQGPPPGEGRDVEGVQRELSALRAELESLEISHFELVCRNLGTLRLHSCDSLGEVLDTMVEVSLNFLGVGALVIYLASEDGRSLYSVAGEGVEPHDVTWPGPQVVEALNQAPAVDDELLIPCGDEMGVLPLRVDGALVGALRLMHPLPQKTELNAADLEFLTLLSEHGAVALRRSWLLSTCEASWWNPTTLKALLD